MAFADAEGWTHLQTIKKLEKELENEAIYISNAIDSNHAESELNTDDRLDEEETFAIEEDSTGDESVEVTEEVVEVTTETEE